MNPFAPAEAAEKPGPYTRFRSKVSDLLSHVPLRTRITALVMIAVGLSVALASIAAWVTVRNEILSQLDNGLLSRAQGAAVALRNVEIHDMRDSNANPASDTPSLTVLDSYVTVFGQGGIQTPATDNQPVITPEQADWALISASTNDYRFKTVTTADGTRLRAVTVPVPMMTSPESSGSDGQALTLGESTANTQQTLSRLTLVSLLVGIAGIAVAGSAGITVARAGLRPVDRLTEATEYVARTGELRPIEVQGTDELARLAASFNAMLTALARSQEHQRRLIADAGHELRTPLTSMRTNIDLLAQVFGSSDSAAAARISDADRAELIADVRAQMEELSVLVGDLVELSRDVKPPAAPEPVNLADVVHQAVDRVRRRAPHVMFDMDLDPWFLEGDPATLERAVTNLLDNAAKWSPEDGTVTVRLKDGLLQVSDEGPGIADADLPHVFERFYRSTEARTMPGSGLGLAIVRQAAENHGGRVAAARAPGGGALLGLWLPGQPNEGASDDAQVATGA